MDFIIRDPLVKIARAVVAEPPVAAGAGDLVAAGKRGRERDRALGKRGQEVAQIHESSYRLRQTCRMDIH